MKFLYKIHSGFDGFTPRQIQNRLVDGQLQLGWQRYLDEVEIGDEVWVYFHGPHQFTNGVYVKGIAKTINRVDSVVFLRVREWRADAPLTDEATSKRVAEVVSPRFRQVFLYPEEWETQPNCNILSSGAESCENRLCESCPSWKRLPRIIKCEEPERIGGGFAIYAPAFWLIPKRCYLRDHELKPEIRKTSELFSRFKTGEKALAFPLAMGILSALKKRIKSLDFDCIIPIPLSPDKEEKRELHRTRLLAQELSRRIDVPVAELLGLSEPISKRKGDWSSAHHFETKYSQVLTVSERVRDYTRILLVDDACTRGSTLKCAKRKILEAHPNRAALTICAAVAGQMIVTGIVTDEVEVRAES